jgi:hypothetical protein
MTKTGILHTQPASLGTPTPMDGSDDTSVDDTTADLPLHHAACSGDVGQVAAALDRRPLSLEENNAVRHCTI